ncbi:MAG: LysR family transcriptional regulator [Bacteroidia bacterium]|nr:LysR family transcriptional regulator [Bacteroidia bacterium]
MDYRDKVFMSVAENLSFSKAADQMFISQPAITRHIQELEDRYKITLFERKGNKIYLTAAGKKIYNSYKVIAQKYRELEFEIGQINDSIIGDFKIGASSTISQYIIPKAIASFHKKYPKGQFFLTNGNSFEMENLLLDNKIDMALVENITSQSGIRYRDFLDDELIVVTGIHSVYSRKKTFTKDDLSSIPIVLREQGSGTLEVIKDAFTKHGIDFDLIKTPIHLGSTESIKNFLLDFDGLAIVSERAVKNELYHKSLVKINVNGFRIPRKLRIACKLGHKSRQVELFETFLLNYNF